MVTANSSASRTSGRLSAEAEVRCRAGTLLQFLSSEAPHLALHPALELDEADRVRLQKYTASIFSRHAAALATAAAAAAGAGSSAAAP